VNVSLSRLPTLVVQLWSGCPGSEVNIAAAAAVTTLALTVLHEENKQLQVTVEEGQPSRLSMLAVRVSTTSATKTSSSSPSYYLTCRGSKLLFMFFAHLGGRR